MTIPKRQGLIALKEASSIRGEVSSYDIGYRLGPRINASGRLSSAKQAVELFISNDPHSAKHIAAILNKENSTRQGIEARILEESFSMIESDPQIKDSNSIVLASRNWHQGVIGIVASRIVDTYLKPTILIAVDDNGMGKGSGRSIEEVNIHTALTKCSELLEEFGGHDLAAGITIKEQNIRDFRIQFDKALEGFKDKYVKKLKVDAQIATHDLNAQLMSEFENLAPHGIGNPEPVFLSKSLEVVERKTFKENHQSLKLKNGTKTYDAVWFNSKLNLEPSSIIDIVFTPEINTWNGTNSLRLRIIDVSLHDS